jgi:hypothetical protein
MMEMHIPEKMQLALGPVGDYLHLPRSMYAGWMEQRDQGQTLSDEMKEMHGPEEIYRSIHPAGDYCTT